MIWTLNPEIRNWLPKLQSHRGYCLQGAEENTLVSIQAAYDQGYEMVEFDVRLTADGNCILFHDSQYNSISIDKTALIELRSHIKVSTLKEVFEWFVTTTGFKLNIEIKSKDIFHFELEKAVADLIEEFKLEERVLISSFNPFSLYKIRMLCPKVYRAILLTLANDHGNNIFTRSLSLNYLCRPHMLNLRFSDFSEFPAKYRKLAKIVPLVLWTVNDLGYYKQVESEIHGIISDTITPDELKKESHAEMH